MQQSEFRSLLDSLARGWTDREYERVADLFTDDVFYSDPQHYSFRDRVALLEFFRDDDGHPQSCVFHNCVFDVERQVGVAEYTYSGTYRYHGTVWIELLGDKISRWREYQHRSDRDWKEFWNR